MMKTRQLVYLSLLLMAALALCLATFLLLSGKSDLGTTFVRNLLLNVPLCLVVGFIDYTLVEKSRLAKPWHVLVDWILATATGCMLTLLVRYALGKTDDTAEGLATFIVWNSIVVLGIELLFYNKAIMAKETQLARMEKEKATYQYEALKNQINPHFLFNSLNALASLAYQDAAKTNLFAKNLSAVYRYLLTTSDRQLVSLKEELAFLDAYLFLEKIRFGAAFSVDIAVPLEAKTCRIVPAALQMLVENALKHNVATMERPLHIAVSVSADALTVTNNLQERSAVTSSGVGLRNLHRQYELHGQQISVSHGADSFSVSLPLL